MSQPDSKLAVCANVFTRMMIFKKKGDIEQGHTHEFDHVTLLSSGALKIYANGKEKEFIAPQFIYIRKNVEHKLEALEDNTVAACIHGIYDGTEVTDMIAPEFDPTGESLPPTVRMG